MSFPRKQTLFSLYKFFIIPDFVFEPRKSGKLVPPNSLRRNRDPHSARPSPFGSEIEIRDPSRRRAFRKPVEDAAQDRFWHFCGKVKKKNSFQLKLVFGDLRNKNKMDLINTMFGAIRENQRNFIFNFTFELIELKNEKYRLSLLCTKLPC